MPDLNIRDFPEEVLRALKSSALDHGETLRLRCITILGEAVGARGTARTVERQRQINEKVFGGGMVGRGRGCPSCGAITGHQKWCKEARGK